MTDWQEIQHFPTYSVSYDGRIRNDETDRTMRLSTNQRGIVNVGLMRNGVQHKRSVAVLVARAFITTARSLKFNTPINLDGDRRNNHADNLMWRPRSFATEYFRQFEIGPQGFGQPIVDIKTGEVYETSWDAALTHGLLDRGIAVSIVNHTYVWPTYQQFKLVR